MSDQGRESVVRARELVKKYGDFTAVDRISFDIYRGENLAFLGPNGAGKSTTIRMMYGFISITDGRMEVLGKDVVTGARAIKARIGVVPQDENLDRELSVRQQLLAYARYFRIPRAEAARRADELIEFAQLKDREKEIAENLSGGMKRRLLIARALINNPEMLILDEPTTGLDPPARHIIWQKLRQLKQEGMTILLTTHYMEEAEKLSDRLLMINHGKIVAEGKPADLIREHAGREVVELHASDSDAEAIARALPEGTAFHVFGDAVYVYVTRSLEAGVPRVAIESAIEATHPSEVLRRSASLEDVFLKLSGRTLRD